MGNNSKCSLKIKEAISICTVLIILGTNIQLLKNNERIEQIEVAKNNEEEIQITQNLERDTKVTTRSQTERTLKTETKIAPAKLKYKKIEELEISKNMDLTQSCGISKEDFNKLMTNLKVDKSGFFERNSDLIYDLCEKYEINEIFFCGLIAAESGWNISANHRNTNNYISMMSGGKLIKYSSEEEGLEAATKLLHTRYLTPGGSCYFGNKLEDIQKRFCPNSSTWVGLVFGCMKQVIK